MDMTDVAINRLYEIANEAGKNKVVKIGERNYGIDGEGNLNLVVPKNLAEDVVHLSTLSGIVTLIKNMGERADSKLFLQVESPDRVNLFGSLDEYGRRENLASSHAILPNIAYSSFMDAEVFNVSLQSQFVQTDDRNLLLQVVGNLEEKEVHRISDDGVSQAVNIKSGVASVDTVKVPNPVLLKPFRTFTEVEQPESRFIFRMLEGMKCALFEADGGAWKHAAMNNVANYLEYELADLTQNGHVVIIA